MENQAKIQVTFTDQTMGGDDISGLFAAYAEKRLAEKYPNAEIRVSVDDRLSSTALRTSGIDCDEVDAFLDSLWNHELDKALESA